MGRRIFWFLIFATGINLSGNKCFSQDKNEKLLSEISARIANGNKSAEELTVLNTLVTDFISTSTPTEAVTSRALEVVNLARTSDCDTCLAEALINLVRCYLTRYESIKALEHALEARSIYEKTNNHSRMGYTLLQLGVIYYTQNLFVKSNEYYNEALGAYEEANDTYYIATLYYLSGINYSKMENFAPALVFFRRAMTIKQRIGDIKGLAECHIGLAEMFLGQDQPDSVLFYVDKAEMYAKKEHLPYGIAKAFTLKAESYFQLGKYEMARIYSDSAAILAQNLNARELLIDTEKINYKINARKGDFKSALEHLEMYMTQRDSIINEKTARSISALETNYAIDKKQSEILLLEKEKRNQTIMLRATIIIGILALLLSLLYYNKHQMKLKANLNLEKAYRELETTQQQLVQQEKLASLGQLTAGIAHEIKNPLNFVNNFSKISADLIRELNETTDERERNLILTDISMNLEKIAQHGDRANSIITRMLEHSRSGKREIEEADINRLIREYLNLAYQAIRIKYPGFGSKLELDLQNNLPMLHIVIQEISRVLVNVFNNSLYALSEKKSQQPGFAPLVHVETRIHDNKVIIKVSDNGPGIPEEIIDKIFQPFFTTKPSGEGTGLGLSISNDIVKAHGGELSARNPPTGGAEFTIALPVGHHV